MVAHGLDNLDVEENDENHGDAVVKDKGVDDVGFLDPLLWERIIAAAN